MRNKFTRKKLFEMSLIIVHFTSNSELLLIYSKNCKTTSNFDQKWLIARKMTILEGVILPKINLAHHKVYTYGV